MTKVIIKESVRMLKEYLSHGILQA
jgi:hypothetical protein